MVTTITYREIGGRVVKAITTGRKRLRGEPRPARHFSDHLLKQYHALECEQGSRFQSTYSKTQIKRAHETALQRFDQTGVEA